MSSLRASVSALQVSWRFRPTLVARSQDRNLDSLVLSRLAQLVERKTLNLVVVGSSPTVGVPFCWRGTPHTAPLHLSVCFLAPHWSKRAGGPPSGYVLAPVAQLAARRSHNPKVASSILAGSIAGWVAERSKALV